MLLHLAIRDLAIIEKTAIDFGSGLNVLTGETGAGKSIVVGALNLVLGDRARSDTVRRGCDKAEVQALFRVPSNGPVAAGLRDKDLVGDPAAGDDTVDVIVRRIVAPGGRGRAYVNDRLVNVGTLAEVMRGMVDIASQHQHTALLDARGHLDLLDRFGGLAAERGGFDAAWTALVDARRRRDALREQEQERLQREDYVRFQLDEIDRVAPQPGEDETLHAERERLAHAESLLRGSREVEIFLSGRETSAHEQVQAAARALERLVGVDAQLEPFVERLESAHIELEDIAFELRRYGDGVEIDPHRLEQVEERLDALKRLQRKHGLDAEGLLERAAELREEVEGFESLDEAIREAEADVGRLEDEARAAAEALSKARAGASRKLEEGVARELSQLAMPGARIRFRLERRETLGAQGLDDGEILIRTNVGEGEKPLARVASGGELSRLLLALKAVLARVDDVGLGVFDEVDTGVGGAVAEVIGLELKSIAGHRQVIAITHLPQIAAHANHHVRVEKETRGGRTTTRVTALDPADRTDEIARMLGGLEITSRTREHAAELLERGSATA
ncbi:MAG: DNA repair protein RecN [Myxococcota bacterium]